ncbi:B-cell receptor CD22 [Anabas testudineus]|uniref:B-cell receptor CD22 n=1 Tax=Anabas testudineus TaxID=64144 RepID=A0A3Q1HSV1_ANATE|nr:B-cell receptor CD22 [Anabas testudineus]XP_026226787.1 B-cell receptor CD22 [Anabas testudineus]
MTMNFHTVGCLVFLTLIKNISCEESAPFKLDDSELSAIEGSCIEIKCRVTRSVPADDAYWFWMKDAQWIDAHKNFTATIIYSTNNLTRPVSPDFAGRVQYVGSSSSDWKSLSTPEKPLCSVLICNLRKNDSGQYSFRFIGPNKKNWVTKKNVTLTVKENPCPISFEKPPVVNESGTITLRCSTLHSCSSDLQIDPIDKDLSLLHSIDPSNLLQSNTPYKSKTVSIPVNWEDDGKEFSCQTLDNKDKYMIQNVSITVEYSPKNTLATKSSDVIKERDSVTLTCSAKGRPKPTFTWFKKEGVDLFPNTTGSELNFTSIKETQNGDYYCEATNTHGKNKSNPITINVTYAPDVEIKMTPTKSAFKEGDTMTLSCNVKRSNPQPKTYKWFKDGVLISGQQNDMINTVIKPEDRGNYKCQAINSVGAGTSKPLEIKVEYHPRRTTLSTSESDSRVKIEHSLRFTCNTDAYPPPTTYSWYRYSVNKKADSSQWTSTTTHRNVLQLEKVQKTDEACYMCNATNSIDTGENSDEVCIRVLYPPTKPELSMTTEVTENKTITISCTVESFPPSKLTLWRSSKANTQLSSWHLFHDYWENSNNLLHRFNVTSNDAGLYICKAQNSEGLIDSTAMKLVVKYVPKDVMIQSESTVVENNPLKLCCIAKSFPRVSTFTWTKDGKEIFRSSSTNFSVKSAGPSDSGLYRCAAKNEIGTGQSQEFDIKVKYGPKYTKIIQSTEKQSSNGMSYVELNCSTWCYPAATKYLWYKEEKNAKTHTEVHNGQIYTVNSDQPGVYYCVATNEIDKQQSASVHLFDGSFMKILKILLCLFLILFIILIAFVVYRYRKKKQQTSQGTSQPCFSILGWSNNARRGNLIHETVLAEPCRSRDDLLPEQSYHPGAQRCQPPPDSTSASDKSCVYSMINFPRKQAPNAQKPTGPPGGHTVDLQKNTQAKPAEDAVYAKVSREKPNSKDCLTDYENINATHAANPPYPYPFDDDTDTSDDDVQLNYAQVTFTANPGHQRSSSDSSSTSSGEDEIQYSDIKI